jgi:hypothetical protein
VLGRGGRVDAPVLGAVVVSRQSAPSGSPRAACRHRGPLGVARTTYSLSAETGGTHFAYENEFELPAGGVGATASRVVSRYAEREADASLSRLKQLAEG